MVDFFSNFHQEKKTNLEFQTISKKKKEEDFEQLGFFAQSVRLKLPLPQAVRLSIFLKEINKKKCDN